MHAQTILLTEGALQALEARAPRVRLAAAGHGDERVPQGNDGQRLAGSQEGSVTERATT